MVCSLAGSQRVRVVADHVQERSKLLADAEANRIRVVAAADSERLRSEAVALRQNPLLINKIMAERLSDKIQIMMVPMDGKFFLGDMLRGTSGGAIAPQDARRKIGLQREKIIDCRLDGELLP